MISFQVKVIQKKFTLLHADFSKIVLKYSNEVHLLRYLTPLNKYLVSQYIIKHIVLLYILQYNISTYFIVKCTSI
jgi:hypothetical protein